MDKSVMADVVVGARAGWAGFRACKAWWLGTDVGAWGKISEARRVSCVDAARAILDGSVKTAQGNHEAWLARRRSEGWVHGPAFDEAGRITPNLIEWKDMSLEERCQSLAFLIGVRTAERKEGLPEEKIDAGTLAVIAELASTDSGYPDSDDGDFYVERFSA